MEKIRTITLSEDAHRVLAIGKATTGCRTYSEYILQHLTATEGVKDGSHG